MRWLHGIAHSRSGGEALELRARLQLLFGMWVGENAVGICAPSRTLRQLVEGTAAEVRRRDEVNVFDPYGYDSKLVLLCHMAMVQLGSGTEAISRFALAIAEALQDLPELPPRYGGEAFVLHRLGYLPRPRPPRLTGEHLTSSGLALLRSDRDAIRAACRDVAGASFFGTRPVDLAPARSVELAESFGFLLLDALRNYDLEAGTLLLRTLRYLGARQRRFIRLAADYLSAQQQEDGRFGYLGREIIKMRNPRLDADVEIYLPITVSVLWALAETLAPGFRAVSSLAPRGLGDASVPWWRRSAATSV